MPPVTKAGGSAFRKDVEFVAKDDDEQIAAGIVMVPDKADLQHDFAREDTIRGFADQFETFVEAGEAGGGVMHAVWPDDWMELERNEVLDEAEEIGGTEAPAGAWIQEWHFAEDELWSLVDDGLLAGYSIGAIDVGWDGPYEQDDVDDVAIPDALDDEALIWELESGIIREVSAVDIPAVPDAQILETKADTEKRLADYIGDRDGFVEEALERNSDWSEDDAERLWDVMNDAVEAEGSGEPGKQSSLFERIGKAAVNALRGDDAEAKSHTADTPAEDSRKDRDRGAEKEGRTLSRQNEDDLKAVIDAATSIFRDAGKEPGITRFTDREDDTFDLSDHTAREFDDPEDDEDDEEDSVGTNGPPFESASGGDTPDDTTTMSDDNNRVDPMEDAPEWAKAITDRIDDLEDEKNADTESADAMDDAPEWAKDLADRVDEIEEKALDDVEEAKPEWAKNLEERIDTISQQTATDSQQLGKSETNEKESGFTLDPRKAGR